MAKFSGIVTYALPEANGVSQSGKPWRRRSYVLCYDNSNPQYPREVLFSVLGDKIDTLDIKQGIKYEIEIDFSVREYQGRHYMSATAWKATSLDDTPQATPTPQRYEEPWPQQQSERTLFSTPVNDADSLPFF